MRRHGQAMLEALLAVCLVTSAFLALFKLSQMLTGKILLQHAATVGQRFVYGSQNLWRAA